MFKSLRSWLNFKAVLGGAIFAFFVFGAFLLLLWSARGQNLPTPPSTAILSVIKAPTKTPPGPITTPTPTLASTSSNEPVPLPKGVIEKGDYVKVVQTGGDGLRLHTTAGVSSKVNYVAIEAEVLLVKDGPIEADGYTWWYLQDPYTENAAGWGVANYLAVAQNP